jgi:hypothetical protein
MNTYYVKKKLNKSSIVNMRGTWTPDVPAGPAIVEVGAPDLREAELRRRRTCAGHTFRLALAP